jgi:hypothetical protein
MRPLAVALMSLGLLDLVLGDGGRRRTTAAMLAAGAATVAGALLVGCSVAGSAVLAGTVFLEAWAWVATRPSTRPTLLLGLLSAALVGRAATTSLWRIGANSALDRWAAGLPFGGAPRFTPDRLAYVVSAMFFLAAAGNTFVRLLLRSVGSLAPSDDKAPGGGRVIGSIERVLIFALAVGGQATAATLVISAKGILRFAEVRGTSSEDVDRITEYVLVGSLASYALALAFVPLALA